MKHLLLTTIAAVVLVGCGPSVPDIPIHDAAGAGDILIIKKHIAANTDIDLKCKSCGGTALGHAAMSGHKEIVNLLIQKGADINAKNKKEGTSLHDAAEAGQSEIVELLIDSGADVSTKNNGGATPMHFAAFYGQEDVIELLIDKGADVNQRTKNLRQTPLDKANQGDESEFADLLRKHGGKTSEELKAEGK